MNRPDPEPKRRGLIDQGSDELTDSRDQASEKPDRGGKHPALQLERGDAAAFFVWPNK